MITAFKIGYIETTINTKSKLMKVFLRAIMGLAVFLIIRTAICFHRQQLLLRKNHFGINIGDDYNLITYTQMIEYWKILAEESPRMILEDIGLTAEGRTQTMAIITSPRIIKTLISIKKFQQSWHLQKI